jgi:hypothetical protein
MMICNYCGELIKPDVAYYERHGPYAYSHVWCKEENDAMVWRKCGGEKYIDYEDLHACIDALFSGKNFSFALDGKTYYPLNEMETPWTTVVITSNWYESVYLADEWDIESLKWALEQFAERFVHIDKLPMAIRYYVEWG